MKAERIEFRTVGQATIMIDALGSNNSEFMATRGIHINLLIKNVPAAPARSLKQVYNDIGAEVAISYEAYSDQEDCVTDVIVMGTLCHHREARRILIGDETVAPLVEAIEAAVETAAEVDTGP